MKMITIQKELIKDNIYDLENINEIQCIIPFIKKEWILDIKILKN